MLNTSPLVDPLKNWPNNDLLLTQESRDRLGATRPRLLRVFDWPELRQTFELHDEPASRWKRWNHRQGVGSVLFAGLGVILLSMSPIMPFGAQDLVINFALVFMAVGGLTGVLHWGLLRSRHSWLGHRLRTGTAIPMIRAPEFARFSGTRPKREPGPGTSGRQCSPSQAPPPDR